MNGLLSYTTHPSARLRRGVLGLAVGVAGMLMGACGGDSNTPNDVTTYTVTANEDDREPQQDGSVQYTYTVTVTDTTGATVPNAGLKYEVSLGTITASNSVSDANGTGKVRWTINGAEFANNSGATLKACADSRTQAECTPTTVASPTF